MSAHELITDHLELWTQAVTQKSTAGRGSNGKIELTGIKKLRELILELAVRGKLAEQDPDDEPALTLIEQIEDAKAKSIRKGSSKATPVEDREKYFSLPPNWEWVRLGRIQEFTNGYAFKSSQFGDSGVGVIRIGDVSKDGKVTPKDMRFLPLELAEHVPAQFFVHPQDLVITMTGDVKPGINDTKESFLLNQRVGKLTPYLVSKQFLFLYLSTVAQQKIDDAFGGVIPNVSTREINESVMGLPPLEEQHRIVQKVDELMALCDRLQQQTSNQLNAHETLVDTLLGILTQSANATELADNWARLAEHFDTLFTTEQSIDKLKQTILQLAVMGRLVVQSPSDAQAPDLLKAIQKEKDRLIESKRIKKSKTLSPVLVEEEPYALPDGWMWSRIGSVSLYTEYGTSAKTLDSVHGIPVVKMGDIQDGSVLIGGQKHAPKTTEGIHSLLLQQGDLLYNRTNSPELVGKTGIFRGPDNTLSFASYLIRIKVAESLLSANFLNLVMNSPLFRETEINPHLKQQCGQANVNGTILKQMKVPLPPREEQKRIVQKADELMALCDHLKQRLNQASKIRCQLAGAVVEGALN